MRTHKNGAEWRVESVILCCATPVKEVLAHMTIQQQTPAPDNQRVLVCVAWPYAKTSTHVGQIVGSFLPGDIFARYHRLAGHDVLMVSGSDAHGTPITVDADKEGILPGELAARYHAQIVDVLDQLGVTFDCYTIT